MPSDSTGCHWRPNMSTYVTHIVRYVQRRDPDRAVKPQPLELPRRQDGGHMRRLAVLTANHRYVWRLQLRKLLFSTRVTFGPFDWVTGSLEARPVPGRLFMRSMRSMKQDRKWLLLLLLLLLLMQQILWRKPEFEEDRRQRVERRSLFLSKSLARPKFCVKYAGVQSIKLIFRAEKKYFKATR